MTAQHSQKIIAGASFWPLAERYKAIGFQESGYPFGGWFREFDPPTLAQIRERRDIGKPYMPKKYVTPGDWQKKEPEHLLITLAKVGHLVWKWQKERPEREADRREYEKGVAEVREKRRSVSHLPPRWWRFLHEIGGYCLPPSDDGTPSNWDTVRLRAQTPNWNPLLSEVGAAHLRLNQLESLPPSTEVYEEAVVMLTDLSQRIVDWVKVNYRHLPLPPQFPSGGYWKSTLRDSLKLYATYMRDLARFEFGELPDVVIPNFNKRGIEWEDLSPIHVAAGRAYLEAAETVTACAPALGRLLHIHNTVRKGSPEMDADIEALDSNLLLLDTRLRTRLRS